MSCTWDLTDGTSAARRLNRHLHRIQPAGALLETTHSTQPTSSSPSSSPTRAGIAERPCNSIPVTAETVGTAALSNPLHEASRPLSSAHLDYIPSHPLLHYDHVPFSCPLPHFCSTHFIVLSIQFTISHCILHCIAYFITLLCHLLLCNVMFHL